MVAAAKSVRRPTSAPGDGRSTGTRTRLLGLMDVGVLLAAILMFLLFLILLVRIVFPQGSRLADLGSGGQTGPLVEDQGRGFSIASDAINEFGDFIARLADVRREVKIRSADSIAWSDAKKGISVGDRDAVQTFSNSRARVDFTTDNELRIGQNSLVIFRSGAADPFLQRRDPAVVVLEGELTGIVSADYGSFAVELPVGLVVMKSDNNEGSAVDFKLSINPDKSSTIAIHSGVADINIAGEHYRVTANTGLTISEDGRTAGVRALPAMPKVRLPGADSVSRFRDIPPRVGFRWDEVAGAQNYRLELARDSRFEEIVVDEYLNEPSFVHGNLDAGAYYWRVSARSGWVQGPATQARRLRVLADVEPPMLELSPIEPSVAGAYTLRGRTARDATVYVRGEQVPTSPDGSFEYLFNAEPGAHPIVVEAIDPVGNVTYNSQIFHVRTDYRTSN